MKLTPFITALFFSLNLSTAYAGPVATMLKEFMDKNIQMEKLKLDYHLIDLDFQSTDASKPWNLGLEASQIDSKLESASPSANDTLAKAFEGTLSKSFFSGTTLSLGAGMTQYDLTARSSGTETKYSEGIQSLSLSQDIGRNFFGIQDRADLNMALLGKEAGQVALNKGTQAQALNFYSALLKASLSRSMVAFSEEAHRRGVQHTALVRVRVRDGLREKVDLYQVEMTERSLAENVLSAKKEYQDASTELSALLQRKVLDQEIIDLMQEKIAHRKVSSIAWDQSMDAELLEKELETLKLGVKKANSGLIPTIKLNASFKNNALDDGSSKALSESTLGGSDREMVVGVALNWNIGSELESINKQKASAQLMYKEAELVAQQKAYELEISKIENQLSLIDQQIDSSLEKMKLASQVLAEYTRLYNQGRADLDRLIDAESSLINTQNGHISYLFSRELLAANLLYIDNELIQYLKSK